MQKGKLFLFYKFVFFLLSCDPAVILEADFRFVCHWQNTKLSTLPAVFNKGFVTWNITVVKIIDNTIHVAGAKIINQDFANWQKIKWTGKDYNNLGLKSSLVQNVVRYQFYRKRYLTTRLARKISPTMRVKL